MNKLQVARTCHEVNRAYCETLGDFSQLPWSEAPDWQHETVLAGVNFHLANPNTTPKMSHESWLEKKKADGWVYGKVKDAEKKTHPCMLPYDKLPDDQKVKDFLFVAVINSFR